MKCFDCQLYESNPIWNRCNLTGFDCFYPTDNCEFMNDDYIVLIDCKGLGLKKGECLKGENVCGKE